MLKTFIGAAIGGLIGFAAGYLMHCTSGACPLASNPLLMTFLGAILGAMASRPR